MLDSGNNLRIKNIMIASDQNVMKRSGRGWSLRKWIKAFKANEEYENRWAFRNGYYAIYKPFVLNNGDEYRMLELAVVNICLEYILYLQHDAFIQIKMPPFKKLNYYETSEVRNGCND